MSVGEGYSMIEELAGKGDSGECQSVKLGRATA